MGEIDQRHQSALLPSHINCKSVTRFHSSNLQHLGAASSKTMIISEKALRETSNGCYLWA